MGLSTDALAELCGTFARAGIDVIKDDHGLADQAWSRFEERVPACLAAAHTRSKNAAGAGCIPPAPSTPSRNTAAI